MTHPPIADPEVLRYIAEVESFFPDGTATASAAGQRAAYDALAAHYRAPRPSGLTTEDTALPGPGGPIPVRHYRPGGGTSPRPRIVFFHGGGFVVGGLESHDDVVAEFVAATGAVAMAVDYRLAPEHLHPAAFDDARAATEWALARGPVVLAGDSAGGSLAASVAHALRGADIRGQMLIYPGLGGERLGLAAYTECATAPLLTTADIHSYRGFRTGGAPEPESDPRFSALAAADHTGTAPCFASAAGVDPLRDDPVEYVRRLNGAGVAARCVVEPQLPHSWMRARHQSARAGAAFARLVQALSGYIAP